MLMWQAAEKTLCWVEYRTRRRCRRRRPARAKRWTRKAVSMHPATACRLLTPLPIDRDFSGRVLLSYTMAPSFPAPLLSRTWPHGRTCEVPRPSRATLHSKQRQSCALRLKCCGITRCVCVLMCLRRHRL